MYILKIYDNERKEIVLEVKSNSLKVILDYALPYGSEKYQILIKCKREDD